MGRGYEISYDCVSWTRKSVRMMYAFLNKLGSILDLTVYHCKN